MIDVIVDGQFGSTGKGLLASFISDGYEIYASGLSPNAGHSFYWRGNKVVTKQLPVGAIMNPKAACFLSAGSIIEPVSLLKEVEKFGIRNLSIHPNAAIVTQEDILAESQLDSSVAAIGSTCSGTGAALARKIMRKGSLAKHHSLLSPFIENIPIDYLMRNGVDMLYETSQGISLSINSEFWPHCTSREVSPAQVLSDLRCNVKWLRDCYLSMRMYPIRVGNKVEAVEGGYSGDFYPDSRELSWEELGREKELTTVTGRVRRIATFSIEQLKIALEICDPRFVFLNFANYTHSVREFKDIMKLLRGKNVLVGTSDRDIVRLDSPGDIYGLTGLWK